MSLQLHEGQSAPAARGSEDYFIPSTSRASGTGGWSHGARSNAVMQLEAPLLPERSVHALDSTPELERHIEQLLARGWNGELRIEAAGSASICLTEGTVAWVRLDDHPENLGAVLGRELGLSMASLRRAMNHCRSTGQRFGAGLVELGLVSCSELRDCLQRHFADQLWELLDRPGPVAVEQIHDQHRYDHDYTFALSELLARPSMPSDEEAERLAALVAECQAQLPRLQLACVIENEEGTLLHTGTGPDHPNRSAEDMLGLCTAGLRRLMGNRLTGGDGPPRATLLTSAIGTIVVQPLGWRPEWLLVLGGRGQPGAMLSAAAAAAER
ncbi:MAG: hypothetical protein K0V04_16465 [Deltaproteobacteria bacterium]|nr:hypothetical protein [Deltaproteobacteria bacterium]